MANKANTSTVNDLLDGKLDKTGGTMTGRMTIRTPDFGNQLCLDVTNDSSNLIRFQKNGTNMGFLGFNSSDEPIYADKQGHSKVLLHAGNVGEYAALISEDIFAEGQPNNVLGYSYSGSSGLTNAGPAMVFGKENYRAYLHGRDGVLKFNTMENGTLTGWKTIAFTDSDITGNAATATKLKTAVSLWGNTFDGTQSLNNKITLANRHSIAWEPNNGAANIEALVLNDGNNFLIGQGVAKAGGNTLIYGNNIKFCYGTAGTSASTAMTINSYGNISIGDSDRAGNGAEKLYVEGNRLAVALNDEVEMQIYAKNSVAKSGILVASSGDRGLYDFTTNKWVIATNGEKTWMSAGNVGIGVLDPQYKLDVNGGEVRVQNNIYVTNASLFRSFLTDGTGHSLIGVSSSNQVLINAGSDVPTIIRGGNVLIGLANDNGAKLQVNGTSSFSNLAVFNGGALIPTGQKLTIGDAVLEYDGGLKSSHNFIGNLTGTATKISNVLKFGSKTFDGSSEQTITATDLGITSDTVSEWGFTKNAGTVTSIATGTGLTGGPITGTGTISLNSTYQTYCTNGNAA